MKEESTHKTMILNLIRLHGGKTISEISNILNLSRPTTYLHLRTLEDRGYIRREKSPKKKGAPVTIYPVEKKLLEKDKREMLEALQFVKEHNGLDIKDLKNFKDGNWTNTLPFAHLQFRGLITKKTYITPEGERFLKENSK